MDSHPKITTEQLQAVRQQNGQPVPLDDDTGNPSFVILRMDLFKALTGDESFNIADTYAAQETALSAIWSDPQLDEYTDQDGSPIE